jgi:hypothetical protein
MMEGKERKIETQNEALLGTFGGWGSAGFWIFGFFLSCCNLKMLGFVNRKIWRKKIKGGLRTTGVKNLENPAEHFKINRNKNKTSKKCF